MQILQIIHSETEEHWDDSSNLSNDYEYSFCMYQHHFASPIIIVIVVTIIFIFSVLSIIIIILIIIIDIISLQECNRNNSI